MHSHMKVSERAAPTDKTARQRCAFGARGAGPGHEVETIGKSHKTTNQPTFFLWFILYIYISLSLSFYFFSARKVLSAALLPDQGQYATCRHAGDQESLPETTKPRASPHSALQSEGRRHDDGIGPAGRRRSRHRAIHGRRVSDGHSGDRGHRLHDQGVFELCDAHPDDGGAS